jgi:hypothetical protein
MSILWLLASIAAAIAAPASSFFLSSVNIYAPSAGLYTVANQVIEVSAPTIIVQALPTTYTIVSAPALTCQSTCVESVEIAFQRNGVNVVQIAELILLVVPVNKVATITIPGVYTFAPG